MAAQGPPQGAWAELRNSKNVPVGPMGPWGSIWEFQGAAHGPWEGLFLQVGSLGNRTDVRALRKM